MSNFDTNLGWQNRSRVNYIKRQVGKITIPAFSAVCGRKHSCLNFGDLDTSASGYAVINNAGTAPDPTTALTFEAWIKIVNISPAIPFYIFQMQDIPSASKFSVSVNSAYELTAQFLKGAVSSEFSSFTILPAGEWIHVAIVWDGVTANAYIDGELDGNQLSIAAPIDSSAGGDVVVGNIAGGVSSVKVGEIRLWSNARTQDEIQMYRFAPRGLTDTDPTLTMLCEFKEGAGNTTLEAILGINAPFVGDITWDTDDCYPYRYGASFIPALFSVETEKNCGFRNPVAKPSADCNFVLCASKVVSEGVVARYYFWEVDGIILPYGTLPYTGQSLGTEFTLEIWNKDGEEFSILEEDLVLKTLINRLVTVVTYGTFETDAAIAINTALGTDLPLVFPLSFDTQPTY